MEKTQIYIKYNIVSKCYHNRELDTMADVIHMFVRQHIRINFSGREKKRA